jgi:integrase
VKQLSTSQLLKKTGVPCLRRHKRNGRYYAVKKIGGKIKSDALRTAANEPITDRKLAERHLRQWLDNLSNKKPELPHKDESFRSLLEKYRAVNAGMEEKTRKNVQWVIEKLKATWPGGLDISVETIKTSDVGSWMAKQLIGLRPASFNEVSRQLKNIFELAVNDGIIPTSPYAGVARKRRKVNREPPKIPTLEQFHKIVEAIRTQRFTDHANDSANLVEFLGLSALGEAEAQRLTWQDVKFSSNGQGKLSVQRRKTGKHFQVPMYSILKPLMLRLYNEQGRPNGRQRVFKTKSCRKALTTACKELGYPVFSPRSLRQFAIVRLLRCGVHPKLVARFQGHSDGGKLILDTYSEVISGEDRAWEEAELAKVR